MKKILNLFVVLMVVFIFSLTLFPMQSFASGWVARTNVSHNWQSVASNWDGTKLAAVVWGGYIYTSTDSGITWTQRTTTPQNWKYISSSGNGTKLTAVINGGIAYNSIDSGVTWTTNGSSTTHVYFTSVASEYDGDQVVATSGTSAGDGIIYLSTTGGAYFNVSSAPSRNWKSVAASSKYATNGSSLVKLVAAAWDGYIYTSANFGVNWTARTNVARKWQAVVSDWTGTKLAAAVYGGYIYTSTDGGVTWTQRTTNARNWYTLASSDDGSKLVAAVENGYIYTSTDGGVTWTEETGAGSRKWHSVISSTDGTKMTALDYGGYIYTRVQPPTITTQAASSVTANTATLNGNVTLTEGGNVTIRGFNYGTTTSYGTNTSEGGSFNTGAFSKNIPDPYKNINCGTTYHYRSYATNSGGTGYGNDQTFTTSACTQPPPVVYTSNASNPSTNGMKLSGGISSGTNITTRGFEVGTDTAYGIPIAENGSFGLGSYSITATTLACGTRYHYRSYAVDSFGTGYGNDMTASTNACTSFVPTLTTQAASSITKTTATLNGNITGTGGQNITLRGFEVGPDTNYGIPVYETGSFTTGAYTKVMISGLSCGNTYHYRSYAKNSVGNGYGNDQTFTTSSCTATITVPTLTTQAATSITTTGATLTGTITSTGGENATIRGFNYGTTTSYGNNAPENGSFGIGSFTKIISSLVCGTTYHFRGYATNSAGTGYGLDRTFTTDTCTPGVSIPTITTSSATNIITTGATLNGNITATGGENATIRGFNYGTTTSYGNNAPENGSFGTGSFTKIISSLVCGTTYHYRAYATNSAGTGYGEDKTFTTSSCSPTVTVPTVSTQSATSVAYVSAIFNGTITSNGNQSVTEKGFQYGPGTDYGSSVVVDPGILSNPVGPFSKNVAAFSCGNTYHYRAYAKNSTGTGYGNDQTFATTTCPTFNAPTLTTQNASSISDSGATLNGTVTSVGGTRLYALGFQYGITTDYGTTVSYDSGSTATGTYVKNISGLSCDTLYHYHAYASNSAGTGYGNDMSFTTSDCSNGNGGSNSVPTFSSQGASSITKTSAILNGTIVDTGGFNPNVRGFNYGTTTSYGSTTQETGSFGVGPFSGTVTNLTCGTKYHYQSYATNSVGSGYGSDAVFDTVSCASDMGGNALFGLESMNEATRVPTVTSTIELPPSQNSSFTRNLRVGMTGEDIKALQAYLNTHGHIIAKTGPGSLGNETAKFGLKTESALMSFQKENGLPSDGVAGPETWAKMK